MWIGGGDDDEETGEVEQEAVESMLLRFSLIVTTSNRIKSNCIRGLINGNEM